MELATQNAAGKWLLNLRKIHNISLKMKPLIQGGILGVLADVAGGVSLYSLLADPAKVVIPTVEFKLNFLRPARQGDILALGKVPHLGRQFAVSQVDICTREMTLLATGLFTYMIQNAE